MQNDKSATRNHYLELRKAMPSASRQEASQRIRAHLVQWLQEASSQREAGQLNAASMPYATEDAVNKPNLDRYVGLYAATRGEVDVLPLVSELSGSVWRTATPRTDVLGKALQFYEVTPNTQWTKGAYGILEPESVNAGAKVNAVSPEHLAVILVPGVAFSRDGVRIGYGGGYYDRFLSQAPHAVMVGVAFLVQVTDRLFAESHDIRMTHLVTEDGIIHCG